MFPLLCSPLITPQSPSCTTIFLQFSRCKMNSNLCFMNPTLTLLNRAREKGRGPYFWKSQLRRLADMQERICLRVSPFKFSVGCHFILSQGNYKPELELFCQLPYSTGKPGLVFLLLKLFMNFFASHSQLSVILSALSTYFILTWQ